MTTPNTPLRDAIAETIYYDQPFYDSGEVLDNHQVIPHDPVPFEALLNFGEHGRKWEEACYKLADQILALLDVREWRPIDSAPKDGTWFFAWIPEHEDGYGDITGGWIEQWAYHDHLEKFARARHTYSDPLIYTGPSFWQPLPQPPQTQDAGGGDDA